MLSDFFVIHILVLSEGDHLEEIFEDENWSFICVVVDEAERVNVHTFDSLVIQSLCLLISLGTNFQHIDLSDFSFRKLTEN